MRFDDDDGTERKPLWWEEGRKLVEDDSLGMYIMFLKRSGSERVLIRGIYAY
jgi:hypothetical protein